MSAGCIELLLELLGYLVCVLELAASLGAFGASHTRPYDVPDRACLSKICPIEALLDIIDGSCHNGSPVSYHIGGSYVPIKNSILMEVNPGTNKVSVIRETRAV